MYRCLCEHGAGATPEYLVFAEVQRTQVLAFQRTWAALSFGVIVPLVSLLPFLCCFAARGLCRPRAPSTRSSDMEEPTNEEHASFAKLASAERAAASLRTRVSTTFAWAGWFLFVLGFTPFLLRVLTDLTLTIGPVENYLGACFWGIALLPLALRPTDSRLISLACYVCLYSLIASSPLLAVITILDAPQIEFSNVPTGIVVPALIISLDVLWISCLVPTLLTIRGGRCACSTMPPRVKLRRLWLVLRCFLFIACLLVALPIVFALAHEGGVGEKERGYLLTIVLTLPAAVGLTPTNRGRVHRWIGGLGKSGSAQQEAASVAALIGGSGRTAASALAEAQLRFRALPVASLREEELVDNTPSPATFEKTVLAKMGEVDGFVSHSWSDDGSAKYARLHEWAGEKEGGAVRIWLDKASIDQRDIDASLACLPVFLAGCNALLVLAGPTYCSRLWCVMELHVYLRMGGQVEDVILKLLDESADFREMFSRFDAGAARCFLDSDRQHLLAVIETGFGNFAPFNKLVRGIFTNKIALEGTKRSR